MHDFYTDVGESDQPIPLPNVSSSVLKKASIFHCEDIAFFLQHRLRFLNTANITGESDSRPQMPSHKMKLASAPPTSASGIRNSLQSIKRCFLRSSWLQTISISNHSCQHPFAVNPKHPNVFDSDVGCKTVANMIKGKTPEEIRKLFNIVNDFTPEEEVTTLFSGMRTITDCALS